MTDIAVDPQLDYAKLKAEQDEIMREQASGAWDKDQSPAHQDWVRTRIKRGIEVTALLRRTNTGPAKPKSKRRGGKGPVDIALITEELLK